MKEATIGPGVFSTLLIASTIIMASSNSFAKGLIARESMESKIKNLTPERSSQIHSLREALISEIEPMQKDPELERMSLTRILIRLRTRQNRTRSLALGPSCRRWL
jgi:hypothetical protein